MELSNELLHRAAPFAEMLGMSIEEAIPDRVTVRMPHRRELQTQGAAIHGGALMSLGDVTAALCAALHVKPGDGTTTAESSTYFFRPLLGDAAIAVARPVRVGRSLICLEVDISDTEGRLCARTTQLMAVQPADRA